MIQAASMIIRSSNKNIFIHHHLRSTHTRKCTIIRAKCNRRLKLQLFPPHRHGPSTMPTSPIHCLWGGGVFVSSSSHQRSKQVRDLIAMGYEGLALLSQLCGQKNQGSNSENVLPHSPPNLLFIHRPSASSGWGLSTMPLCFTSPSTPQHTPLRPTDWLYMSHLNTRPASIPTQAKHYLGRSICLILTWQETGQGVEISTVSKDLFFATPATTWCYKCDLF